MRIINLYQQHCFINTALVIGLSAVLGLSGCQKEGTAEKTGQKIDQAAANAKQSINQSTDAAKQNIEAAKESLETKTEQAGAAITESADAAKAKLDQAGETLERSTENAEQALKQGRENAEKKLEGAKNAVTQGAETSTGYVDDSVITLKAKAAILDDASLKASKLEVMTVNGVVTLKGTVDSEQSKARVVDLIKSQEHVKAVQADLIVSVSTLSK